MAKNYSFALSDKLLEQYLLFKQYKKCDKFLVKKLLRFHTGEEFIYNQNQLDKIGIEVSKDVEIALKRSRVNGKTENELARLTRYKLILTDDKSDFPYVNIDSDHITTNVVGCFYQATPRDKAISHLKELCSSAKCITLYDKYLCENNNYDILKSIISDKKITIRYVNKHLEDHQIDDLKTVLKQCDFEKINDTDIRHHDRYIIIDNKFEIIITSGFEFIKEPRRELTYIIRPITSSRF